MYKRIRRRKNKTIAVLIIAGLMFASGFCFGRVTKANTGAENSPAPVVENSVENVESAETYEEITLTATAYCACEKCCGGWAKKRPLDSNGKPIIYTASGAIAEAGKTVAVDPSIYPYGTEFIIDGNTYVAQDCGGAIKGYEIDVYFDSHEDAKQYGRREVVATVRN